MEPRFQICTKLIYVVTILLSTVHLSGQDCVKKLDGWNANQTFPVGVVNEYEDCVEKTEASLKTLEIEIARLKEESNAMIATMDRSYDNLGKYYKSEDLDGKEDNCKQKKSDLPKKHRIR